MQPKNTKIEVFEPKPENQKLLKEVQAKLDAQGYKPAGTAVIDGQHVPIFEKQNYDTISECQVEASVDKNTYLGKPEGVADEWAQASSEGVQAKTEADLRIDPIIESLEALNDKPLVTRVTKRRKILATLSKEDISALYNMRHISVGEYAHCNGIPEKFYPTVQLTPADIGGKDAIRELADEPVLFDAVETLYPIKRVRDSQKTIIGSVLENPPLSADDPDELEEAGYGKLAEAIVNFIGVFKEGRDKVFRCETGHTCKVLVEKKGSKPGLEWDHRDYVLYDPQGKEIARSFSYRDFANQGYGEFFSYFQRKGRMPETEFDIPYGVQHFPQGTVVEVTSLITEKKYDDPTFIPKNQFIVHSMCYNGPRSILIQTTDWEPDIINKEVIGRKQFNAGHVRKIVKRGDGPVVMKDAYEGEKQTVQQSLDRHHQEAVRALTDEQLPMPRLRKGEYLCYNASYLVGDLMFDNIDRTENASKFLDEDKMHRYLCAMGFVRYIHIKHPNTHWGVYLNVVNVKKLRKWLPKNLHRLMHNLDYCEKKEKEDSERYMADMDF